MKSLLKTILMIGMVATVLYSPKADCQITNRGRMVKAIKNGDVEKISSLAIKDVKTGKGFFNSNTLLGEAVNAALPEDKKIEVIKILINEVFTNPNQVMISKTGKKTYPLIELIKNNEIQIAEMLIDDGKAFVHVRNEAGETPLSSILGLLKKWDTDRGNIDPENNIIKLVEKITEGFSCSLTADSENSYSDTEAYALYSAYASGPIDSCITGTWDDTLYNILRSPMATDGLVISALTRAITANKPKMLKAVIIETILLEMKKRGLDVNNIMLTTTVNSEDQASIIPQKETPLAMATRLDDAISVGLLIQAGADISKQTTTVSYSKKGSVTEPISAEAIANRYDSRKALKVIYKTPIKYERAIKLLQDYNYGFDSTDLEEQVNAAIKKMVLLNEYQIGDREMNLLFGIENALGSRTGGIYNYFVENAEADNNWIYIALFGILYFDNAEKEALMSENKEIVMDMGIVKLITTGFTKTGLTNFGTSIVINELNTRDFIPLRYTENMTKALELITKTKITTPAVKY